jgi:hypothetical protein
MHRDVVIPPEYIKYSAVLVTESPAGETPISANPRWQDLGFFVALGAGVVTIFQAFFGRRR